MVEIQLSDGVSQLPSKSSHFWALSLFAGSFQSLLDGFARSAATMKHFISFKDFAAQAEVTLEEQKPN